MKSGLDPGSDFHHWLQEGPLQKTFLHSRLQHQDSIEKIIVKLMCMYVLWCQFWWPENWLDEPAEEGFAAERGSDGIRKDQSDSIPRLLWYADRWEEQRGLQC